MQQNDPYLIVIRNIIGESISIRLAPLFLRMQAFFIDLFIVIQIQIFLGFLYFQMYFKYSHKGGLSEPYTFNFKWMLLILLSFSVQMAYYIIQEHLWNGQTIGKKILKLRVVSESGGGISLRSILIRGVIGIIEVGCFPIIGGFVSLFQPKGQRLGDILASCYVIFEEPFT